MKIPLILAQEPVAVPQAPRYQGVQETGLGEVGRGLRHIAKVIGAVAEEKAKHQRATDAMQLYTGFVEAIDEAEDKLKFGETDAAGNLTVAPAPHQTYRALAMQKFDELRQNVKSPDPQTQYVADQLINRLRIERGEKARAHANTLFIQGEAAATQTTIDFWKKNLVEESDPTVYDANKRLVEAFLLSKARVFGPQKAQEMVSAFRQDLAYNTVRRQIDADPFTIIPDRQFADLTLDQQTRLQEYTKAQRELADKAQDRTMKRTSDEVERTVQDAVDAKEWGRAGILLDVEGRRVMEPTRYEHWRERIRTRRDATEDDPSTIRRLNPLVYSIQTDPLAAQRAVDAAAAGGKLSSETERVFRSHLQSLATAKENKDLADLGRRHAQVEQQINNLIPTTGTFGATVVMAAQIREQMLAELARQSKYLGGPEEPEAWFERRKASYVARSAEAGATRLAEMYQALLHKDLATLQANRAVLDRRDPTGRLYYEQLDLLRQHRQLQEEMQRLRPTKTEAPASANHLGRTSK